MSTILEHDLAALEAKIARDAAKTDEERVHHDHVWSNHLSAANLMRVAEKHHADARTMLRAAEFHEGMGQMSVARQFHGLADKSVAAAKCCIDRAAARADMGQTMASALRVPPKGAK